ncbi:MAG: DUF998 domain-containing protein [Aureliella sp.]
MNKEQNSALQSLLLLCGMAVPVAYFGVQVAAAPFYADYSFLSDDASTLGSPGSTFPALFNGGTAVLGVLMLVAAYAVFRGLLNVRARLIPAVLLAISMLAGAVGCFNAALHPMPDEKHVSGLMASLGGFFFLLPFVFPFLFKRNGNHRAINTYGWINLSMLIGLFPIMSGLIQRAQGWFGVELVWYQDFLNQNFGLLQRIATAVVFVPIGILSWHLLHLGRLTSLDAPEDLEGRLTE